MSEASKPSRPQRSVADICEVAELGDKARSLVKPDQTPERYIELLVGCGEFPDAVRFIAHALPKREAVWWAWVCARKCAGAEPPPPVKASLAATETWIAQPNETNRQLAMKAAGDAEFSTAAGCAGLAAFFSGPSLSPPNAPPNPPGEFMAAKAVAGAVMIAAVATEPEKASEKYRAFVAQGVEVAHRIKLWEPAA